MKRVVLALVVVCSALAYASVSALEAKAHLGENATVCGEVASAHYAASSRGKPTFINLDRPYPNQLFTILIWGENRARFGRPEQTYLGKHICVTGQIRSYRGVPETIASHPSQISIE
jgi:hypothetical protein